jgi:uncharacterized membrane protein YeiH
MTKQTTPSRVTKSQIYRSVASSTAIETGESVQKIEQQLKRIQLRAKAIGLATFYHWVLEDNNETDKIH